MLPFDASSPLLDEMTPGYAPKESTGLTHLTSATRNDLAHSPGHVMLGIPSSSPSQTLIALSSKRRNSVAMSGPTMMATSMSSPQQTLAYVEVGDTGERHQYIYHPLQIESF